jgi:hypothetical protein
MFHRNVVEKIKSHFVTKYVSSEIRDGQETMWENIVACCKVRLGAEELLIRDKKNYVTVQADRFEYLNMMPAVKLSVNNHTLISRYQLYSHTCWNPGKHYHSLYKR